MAIKLAVGYTGGSSTEKRNRTIKAFVESLGLSVDDVVLVPEGVTVTVIDVPDVAATVVEAPDGPSMLVPDEFRREVPEASLAYLRGE